jgi:hypothetical protein
VFVLVLAMVAAAYWFGLAGTLGRALS